MYLELSRTVKLLLSGPIVAATRLPSGRVAVVCKGDEPGSFYVAPWDVTSGALEHVRPWAMVQVAGEGSVVALSSGVREEVLLQLIDREGSSLLALDLDTEMRPLWRWRQDHESSSGEFAGALPAPVAIPGGVLCVECSTPQSAELRALNEEGHPRWGCALKGPVSAPFQVAPDGRILAASTAGEVVQYSARGERLTRLQLDAPMRGLAFGVGGHIAACDRRTVRVWNTAGEELWSLELPADLDGAFAIDSYGRVLLARREEGGFLVSPRGEDVQPVVPFGRLARPWLSYTGALMALRLGDMGSEIVMWPSIDPEEEDNLPATSARLMGTPLAVIEEPHQLGVLCEGGAWMEFRPLA